MIPLPEQFLTLPLAHRGLHDPEKGRPENSLAAIRAAIGSGYGVEVDIQLSADGQAMVFHDDVLDRLTSEQGPVRERTAAALAKISLMGSAEKIPTLADVLRFLDGRAPLLIEIKDQDGAMGANTGSVEKAVAADLQHYGGDVAVMSFNPHTVARLAMLLPDIPRGLVTGSFLAGNWQLLPADTCDRLREIPDFDAVDASFISHNVNDLDRPRVAEIKAKGAPILCWTIKDEITEKIARKIAANITFEGYTPLRHSA